MSADARGATGTRAPESAERSTALQRLQRALDAGSFAATAEERGALALVIPREAGASVDRVTREWLVRVAIAAGYSHVALEIVPCSEAHAALSGGHTA